MFWSNYQELCKRENKSPSGLAKELGISSGTVTGWKKGKIPSESSLQKIAEYFGVSKWDLLGDKKSATQSDGGSDSAIISERTAYANKIFAMLNTVNQLEAINQLLSLLQDQVAQDGQK